MLTPHDWIRFLGEPRPTMEERREILCDNIIEACSRLQPDETISTTELMEMIWPEKFARGDAIKWRSYLFRDIGKMVKRPGDLAFYNSPGEPKKILGRNAIPRLWHNRRVVPYDPAIKASLEELHAATDAYQTGYAEGYDAGYQAGLEAGADMERVNSI